MIFALKRKDGKAGYENARVIIVVVRVIVVLTLFGFNGPHPDVFLLKRASNQFSTLRRF